MANNRTILHLSDEALEAISRNAPSPNKRGAWVSLAVVEYERLLGESAQRVGTLETIDAKLSSLEMALNQILHESRFRSQQRQRRLKPQ